MTDELKTVRRHIHETIVKVSDDVSRRYKFNTAIAAVMELLNHLSRMTVDSAAAHAVRQEGLEHRGAAARAHRAAHHCGAVAGARPRRRSQPGAAWPQGRRAAALTRDEVEMVVQVNGRKRAVVQRAGAMPTRRPAKPSRWPTTTCSVSSPASRCARSSSCQANW
jgi:leucyl-tRNA synthetase